MFNPGGKNTYAFQEITPNTSGPGVRKFPRFLVPVLTPETMFPATERKALATALKWLIQDPFPPTLRK